MKLSCSKIVTLAPSDLQSLYLWPRACLRASRPKRLERAPRLYPHLWTKTCLGWLQRPLWSSWLCHSAGWNPIGGCLSPSRSFGLDRLYRRWTCRWPRSSYLAICPWSLEVWPISISRSLLAQFQSYPWSDASLVSAGSDLDSSLNCRWMSASMEHESLYSPWWKWGHSAPYGTRSNGRSRCRYQTSDMLTLRTSWDESNSP
jgi:hypothetical protein